MNWTDFTMGAFSVIIVYVFFSIGMESESPTEAVEVVEPAEDGEYQISRHVKLYCQQCRKVKSHKEVEPRLFQCSRCKRQTDIRVG